MSTEQKQSAVQVVDTKSGAIAIHGRELVTPQTIDIMMAFLNRFIEEDCENGVNSLIFRKDGFPMLDNGGWASWVFYPDSCAAVCNIKGCIEIAMATALDEDHKDSEFLSVWAGTWLNIIDGFFHETHHAMSYSADRERFDDPDELMREEKLANAYADDMLEIVAKAINMEIGFTTIINDMIGLKVANEVERIIEDENASKKEIRWVECMEYMDHNKLVYYAPGEYVKSGEPIALKTIKEYLYTTSQVQEGDESWNMEEDTISVPISISATPDDTIAEVVEDIPADTKAVTNAPVVQLAVPENHEDEELPFTPDEEILPFTPDEVVEQVAVQQVVTVNPVVANTQTKVVSPVVGVGAFTPLGWDGIKHQAVVKGLYGKIFAHIFQTCGFNPSINTGLGECFAAKDNIKALVPLTVDETQMVEFMECYNEQGQYRSGVKVEYSIAGLFLNKENTLPGYTLTMNRGDGTAIRRKFLPQNPWKVRQDQSFSSTALEAQSGHQILWIIDPDAIDKQFATRLYDGVLQSNVGGSWTAV